MCPRCNSSKGDGELLEWWLGKGKTLRPLHPDVTVAYCRAAYQRISKLGFLNLPAPEPTVQLPAEFADSLPTPQHTDAIAVSWTFTLGKTTTRAMNVSLGHLARIKTSKLRIDYKPIASLSGVSVIIASLPCLEYAHSRPIFRLLSGYLRTISRWFSYHWW